MDDYELRDIQRVIGEVLIPQARAQQSEILPEREALTLGLELYYTAFTIKPRYRSAGLMVARRFVERMGLDSEHVEAFAAEQVRAAISAGWTKEDDK